MRKASALWEAMYAVVVWSVILALTVVFSLAIIASTLVLWFVDPQRRVAHWLASWWGCCVFLCTPTWRLTVHGRHHLKPGQPFILVSNHQSLLDIMALFCVRRQFKWVAKDSLFTIPFLGWAMSMARYVRLTRGERDSIRVAYAATKRWLESGMSVCIFPEGTRSPTGRLLPFKNGAFKLSLETGIPLVPIAIDGTRTLLKRGSWIIRPRARVRITVFPPIDPATYREAGVDRFRDDVRSLIERALTF